MQKYIKGIRKAPSLPPTMKSGKLESNEECGKAELLYDYFISVFGQSETPIPTGTRGGSTVMKISEK